MRRRLRLGLALLAAAITLPTAWVQVADNAAEPLSRFLPRGALLAVEVRDLVGVLADWNGSAEKASWVDGAGYQAFVRSKLGYRLEEARQEFGAAAGFTPEWSLLESIAGAESALGLYDIGEIRFVFVTELSASAAADNALWRVRGDFEPRRAGGFEYYLRQDQESGREAAFAIADGRLLLATSGDLLAKALELLAGDSGEAVTAESWYQAATALGGGRGELRLVENLASLTANTYMRSYWIQQNITALRAYEAAVVDVTRPDGEFREERFMLKREEGEAAASDLGPLLKLVPPEAQLYRGWAALEPTQAVDLLRQKVLDPQYGSGGRSYFSPTQFLGGRQAGSEAALETRIDEEPKRSIGPAFEAEGLQELLRAKPPAVLQLQRGRVAADGVFAAVEGCVVLWAKDGWDEAGALRAVESAVTELLSVSGGPGWTRSDGRWRHTGLEELEMMVSGPYLAVANSGDLLDVVAARLDAPTPTASDAYAAGLRHGAARGPYLRLLGHLDFQDGGGVPADSRQPSLFSENIGGLSETLNRVARVEIRRNEADGHTAETVRYVLP